MMYAAWSFWASFALLALVMKAGWTVALDTRAILALRAALPGLEPLMQVATFLAAGAPAVLLTLGVGVSRVWLGAHWPSDVLAAYLAAAGWACVCLVLGARAEQRAAGTPAIEPAR